MDNEQKGQIILVDNNPFDVELIERYLTSNGFSVITFLSAKEFLECNIKADIIILDYKLDGITGLEIADILNSRGNTIPIAMLTGGLLTSDLLKFCYNLGIKDVFIKTTRFSGLAETLKGWLK